MRRATSTLAESTLAMGRRLCGRPCLHSVRPSGHYGASGACRARQERQRTQPEPEGPQVGAQGRQGSASLSAHAAGKPAGEARGGPRRRPRVAEHHCRVGAGVVWLARHGGRGSRGARPHRACPLLGAALPARRHRRHAAHGAAHVRAVARARTARHPAPAARQLSLPRRFATVCPRASPLRASPPRRAVCTPWRTTRAAWAPPWLR